MLRFVLILGFVLSLGPLSAFAASMESDLDVSPKCVARVNHLSAAHAKCLFNAESVYARTTDATRLQGHQDRCDTRFERRFDRIIQNRRGASCTAVPASTLMGAAQSFVQQASDAAKGETSPQYLFVQSAETATLEDGVLYLSGASDRTIFFSDRPNHIAGSESVTAFVDRWSDGVDSFEEDPPNAALNCQVDGTERNVIVELDEAPSWDGETLAYPVEILSSSPGVLLSGESCSIARLFIDDSAGQLDPKPAKNIVNVVYLGGASGNCYGKTVGKKGALANGQCSVEPGDKLKLALSLEVDSGGVNAWSFGLMWDKDIASPVLEANKLTPRASFQFENPTPPPTYLSYNTCTLTTEHCAPQLTQSTSGHYGSYLGVSEGTTADFTRTVSNTSFRLGTVTFTVKSRDPGESSDFMTTVKTGFFRSDGASMGNAASQFMTPDFGKMIFHTPPECSGTCLSKTSKSW